MDAPPKGIRYQESIDGFRLTQSTRSGAAWFLVPFMTLWSGPMALVTVVGRRELTVRGTKALYFSGFGPIGIRRRFDWPKVNSVREMRGLVLQGGITLDLFGSPAPEQRTFMLHALHRRLILDARPEWS